jgi:hypothetical protein
VNPRILQQQIHSTFTPDTGVWFSFRTGVNFLLTGSNNKADFRDHLCREYNKKADSLSLPTGYFFTPYDGGLRYLG